MQSPYAIDFVDANVEGLTRAVAEDPSFNNNTNQVTAMNVWAFMNEPDGTVLRGEEVQKVDNDWTYTNVQYWVPGDNTYYFAALAPMNSANWSLDDTQADTYGAGVVSFTNVDGTEDLLYAATEVAAPANVGDEMEAVKFEFSHLLSKVKFTFENGFRTDNADIVVTDIKMTAPKSATIDLAVENWWDGNDWMLTDGEENNLTLEFGNVERLDAGAKDDCYYERFTIPASGDQVYNISFKVEVWMGNQLANIFEKTSTVTGVALEMGKAYNFVSEINPENLNLSEIEFEVEVKDWVDGGEVEHPVVATFEGKPYTSLQAAIDAATAGGTIYLASNVKETVMINESDINLVIDGKDNKFDGEIRIHNGSSYDNGSVTIQNVNFETYTADVNFVYAVDFGNANRYSQNITVDNCTFTAVDGTPAEHNAVGVKVNASKNLVITNCEATNVHSLLQAQSCDANILVDNVEVNGKSGVSFGNTAFPTIKNATINAASYGVRADGNARRGELVVENVTIDAYRPIIVRKNTTAYSVEVTGTNTLTAGDYYQVIFTTGDDEATYVAPAAGNFTFTGADDLNVYPTDAAASGRIQDAAGLTAALADASKSEIVLETGAIFEGTFTVKRNVTIKSNANNKATIKGRLNIVNANPTFDNVIFDRNETDSNNAWNTANGSSKCLQYKAVVMIYGNQENTITFENCSFLNNGGTHKSAITNTACELIVNECYFEGRSSAIYSQANLSITNSTFNYTGTNNVIASINGCGDAGGKFIFKGNEVVGEKIFVLGQFLSTVGFANGSYYFDIQGVEGFSNILFNTNRVANKTFAEGSETF